MIRRGSNCQTTVRSELQTQRRPPSLSWKRCTWQIEAWFLRAERDRPPSLFCSIWQQYLLARSRRKSPPSPLRFSWMSQGQRPPPRDCVKGFRHTRVACLSMENGSCLSMSSLARPMTQESCRYCKAYTTTQTVDAALYTALITAVPALERRVLDVV